MFAEPMTSPWPPTRLENAQWQFWATTAEPRAFDDQDLPDPSASCFLPPPDLASLGIHESTTSAAASLGLAVPTSLEDSTTSLPADPEFPADLENLPLIAAQRMVDITPSDVIIDDDLLDEASLDLLVSTLARENALIEAIEEEEKSASDSHSDDDDTLYGASTCSTPSAEDDDDHDGHTNYADVRLQQLKQEPTLPATTAATPLSRQLPPAVPSSSSTAPIKPKSAKPKPKRVRRKCVVPNCGKRSRSQGLCIAHGGGRRCIVEGCDKSSQGGNLCIKHGGGKRCSVEGCDKAAQTHSLCKAHGGGPRCQFANCEKSSQGGGFCRTHGGGKRCAFEGCNKGTQRGDYCALHGGSRLCVVDGCFRNDRGGGYCAHHGGGKRCSLEGCTRACRRNGWCSTHLRLLGKRQLEDLVGELRLRSSPEPVTIGDLFTPIKPDFAG